MVRGIRYVFSVVGVVVLMASMLSIMPSSVEAAEEMLTVHTFNPHAGNTCMEMTGTVQYLQEWVLLDENGDPFPGIFWGPCETSSWLDEEITVCHNGMTLTKTFAELKAAEIIMIVGEGQWAPVGTNTFPGPCPTSPGPWEVVSVSFACSGLVSATLSHGGGTGGIVFFLYENGKEVAFSATSGVIGTTEYSHQFDPAQWSDGATVQAAVLLPGTNQPRQYSKEIVCKTTNPEPSPTQTETPEPSPTNTPSPTVTATASPTESVTETPDPSATLTATPDGNGNGGPTENGDGSDGEGESVTQLPSTGAGSGGVSIVAIGSIVTALAMGILAFGIRRNELNA